MKKELVKFEMNGENFTLFEIQTRTDGTRQTSPAFLLHKVPTNSTTATRSAAALLD